MSVKTNTFMNWKDITATAQTSGATAIVIKEVLDVQEANGEGLEPWQADGNLYPTQLKRATASRAFTIVGGDVATFLAIPRGVPHTVVAVLYDSINNAGTGALTHTWVNAVVADVPASGPSNKFAGGTLTMMCYSADGSTDPLTITQAS